MFNSTAVLVKDGKREIKKQHAFFYQYTAYVIAIRILWEPIKSETDLKLSELILKNYCREIEETFNINACLFTLHAHLHLVEQVKNHGPLNGHAQFFFEVKNLILSIFLNSKFLYLKSEKMFLRAHCTT